MTVEEMKSRAAELQAQIKPLQDELDLLRTEIAVASAPFRVGDIIEKQIAKDRNKRCDRWVVHKVEPSRFGRDDYAIKLHNVRKDGSIGERRENFYPSLYQYKKVGRHDSYNVTEGAPPRTTG